MAKLIGAIQQIAQLRRQFGSQAAFRFVADRLGSRFLRSKVDHVIWLSADDLSPSLRLEPEFEARMLTADEVRTFAADPQNLLSIELADRVAAGHDLCFAILSGHRLAAYGWYALHCIEAEHCAGTAMSYPEHVAYMYNGFTHPDFRGRRLHGLVMGLALRALGERRVTHLVSIVDWTNVSSLRSCERLGYSDLGRMISLFGRGRCQCSVYPRRARELGVCFGKSADLSARHQGAVRLAEIETEEFEAAGI